MKEDKGKPKGEARKSVLLISYHFPPIAVSSGVHRIVSLTNALAKTGWKVTVLTAHTRSYWRIDEKTLDRIHPDAKILRAQAFDTARHFSIRGKYPQMMALPDNYQSWIFFGVIKGLWHILRQRPGLIISTYPLASAHIIAIILYRLTGTPWIADFRDPMAQRNYPADPTKWKVFKWIEECAAKYATRLVFTTPGALEEYRQRYPEVEDHRWQLITNGFDEEQFASVIPKPRNDGVLRIIHSGLIYIHERNPRQLFEALAQLKLTGYLANREVVFVLRASGHIDTYRQWIEELGLDSLIELAPALPYRDALREMLEADGLLLLQGEGCNQQIPAKAYEYLRAGKPLLALTDEKGDTARLLKSVSMPSIAPLNDKELIVKALKHFLERVEANIPGQSTVSADTVTTFSRQSISRDWVDKIQDAFTDHTTLKGNQRPD